jgi:hypothetical protein
MRTGAAFIAVIGGAALAACQPDAPKPVPKAEAHEQVKAVVSPAVAPAPLAQWLVGSWSFESSCASDFIAHFGGDGTLDNSGEMGSWALAGDTVTETIRERYDAAASENAAKVDPPATRSYTIERTDQDHGTITYQGRKVPMLRC